MPFLVEDAKCSNCGKKFNALVPEKVKYYYCEDVECKIKILVEKRKENPFEYGITYRDLVKHYGDNWRDIIGDVIK